MIATHTSEAPAHQKRSSCWALVRSWQQLFAGHSTLDTQQVDMFTHEKSANWTMCEYNVCITNASVAINFRAFDLVYMVKTFHDARNYLKRFNFKDVRASSLFGIIPKHSATPGHWIAISPTWPKSVYIPCWACRLAWQCGGTYIQHHARELK
jgi:hypothetical protein